MSFVSAYGPDDELTHLAEPRFTRIKAAPTGYADSAQPPVPFGSVPFGSGRPGRDRRRAQRPCSHCGQPLWASRTRVPGFHDSCALDAGLARPLSAPGEVPGGRKVDLTKPAAKGANARKDRLLSRSKTCYFCGAGMTRRTVTREHLTPVSRGGKDSADNVVAACRRCNSAKGDMTEAEFVAWVRRVAAHLEAKDARAAEETA